MALELRQVEVRAGAGGFQSRGIVEKVHPEVEEHAGNWAAVDLEVALDEMETPRADHQSGQRRFQLVPLAGFGRYIRNRAPDGVHQVRLAADDVGPARRSGVLEIGHVDLRTGIQRVDDHLAVDRAGDFDAAVLQVAGRGSDVPVGGADRSSLAQKIRASALIEAPLYRTAAFEELVDS